MSTPLQDWSTPEPDAPSGNPVLPLNTDWVWMFYGMESTAANVNLSFTDATIFWGGVPPSKDVRVPMPAPSPYAASSLLLFLWGWNVAALVNRDESGIVYSTSAVIPAQSLWAWRPYRNVHQNPDLHTSSQITDDGSVVVDSITLPSLTAVAGDSAVVIHVNSNGNRFSGFSPVDWTPKIFDLQTLPNTIARVALAEASFVGSFNCTIAQGQVQDNPRVAVMLNMKNDTGTTPSSIDNITGAAGNDVLIHAVPATAHGAGLIEVDQVLVNGIEQGTPSAVAADQFTFEPVLQSNRYDTPYTLEAIANGAVVATFEVTFKPAGGRQYVVLQDPILAAAFRFPVAAGGDQLAAGQQLEVFGPVGASIEAVVLYPNGDASVAQALTSVKFRVHNGTNWGPEATQTFGSDPVTPVQRTFAMSWNVTGFPFITVPISWDVNSALFSVQALYDMSWNVGNPVQRLFEMSWNVESLKIESIQRLFPISWRVFGPQIKLHLGTITDKSN